MATLGDLKTRIITEVNRDDLEDTLADQLSLYISRAIDDYANQRFWFNEARTTGVMIAGDEYLDLPAGARFVDNVYILIGQTRYKLWKRQTWYIEEMYSSPQSGQPTDYCMIGDQIRTWPTANQAYPVVWETVSDVTPALVADTDENNWTNEGQDLIDARTRLLLYRDQFRDRQGVMEATAAQQEALYRLKNESNRRMGTGSIQASW